MKRKRKQEWISVPIAVDTQAQNDKTDKTNTENISIRQMLHTFADKTDISLIAYIGTRHSILWKLIWLTVIVCGFTMTIIQSNDAIHDYFGYAVSLRTTFQLNGTMQFPSVTLCSNVMINWTQERILNTSIYQELTVLSADDVARQEFEKSSSRRVRSYEEHIIIDTLSRYYDEWSLRNLTGYGILNKVYWNGDTYTVRRSTNSKPMSALETEGILYRFHDFYYGNCILFNAETNLEKSLRAAALTGAEFTLTWNPGDRFPNLNDPSVIAVVHPAGTAPILDDSNNIKIHLGDEVTIAVRQREITRLPKPYPSNCVDRTSYKIQSNSVYYEEDQEYLYAVEACIKTCMQKISLDSCFCWDPQIPLGFMINRYKFSTFCKAERCRYIDKKLTSKFCGCKLPCRETLLDLSQTVKSGLIKDIVKKQFNESESDDFQTQNASKIRVFIKSATYEAIQEEPKYTVADFWGIIGGNAGLWIGISAISLFEIVELAVQIVKYKFKMLMKKNNKTKIRIMNQQDLYRKTAVHTIFGDSRADAKLRNRNYKFLPDMNI